MKILGKVFYDSLWEDLVNTLVKSSKRSLHDLAQVLVRRSYGDPGEILLVTSRTQNHFFSIF